ncbi:NADH:ubiquinone oxidoreductase subunit 5 (chain L)/Multisubunit Na+/H+ antiporter, MnhA subunit [Micromonospora viridifaciens]|uniref:NADH:ubiquinone oxidoreductase subunit 5 (Chain L)/Multisubunit Na+/H+ antiporter, MnhA subunit n=1 Tax=Micromonospora viridifaciens TaxID=1881 RepID=A0A1C4XE37_MICVI|nr:proton-conducting transporter membrane subunit [Micromonospora viridifaciens]SCF06749.1 NADH:ubiquinone oxidoreductase subunit 5 (chain L)/Multisubunit Na+/H+ antiporter, MnhA subunit [Micromonospora viridifaciens]
MSQLAQAALWSLVTGPAGAGIGLATTRRAEPIAVPLSLAVAAASVVASIVVAVARPSVSVPFLAGVDFALTVDGLAALLTPMLAGVTLLVLAAATGEIRRSRARFHGLMLLFAASAALTVTAATLPTLLFAWEIMGAASYALIGFWWRAEDRVSAGLSAFLTTRAADLGLYVAAGAALAGGAGLALADLPHSSPGWRHVIAAGILVAALGKAAQLPFSFWLSRAMAGPSPVSALLHSAAMVALGGYLLLRVRPLLAATGWAAPLAMWAGALTALLLGAVALAQRDVKQLLAASTSAQLGFVVLAAGADAVAGGAAQLVAHAATKALLFLAAGTWLAALGTTRLAGLRGVAARWRSVGWSATAGALALAGIPPLSLWATKDAVLTRVFAESPALYAVGLVASALSAAYAGKLLVVIWSRAPAGRHGAGGSYRREGGTAGGTYRREGGTAGGTYRREGGTAGGTYRREGGTAGGTYRREPDSAGVSGARQASLVLLAVGAAAAGLLVLPPVGAVVARAVGQPGELPVPRAELAISAVLALAVVVLVTRRPAPEPRWALRWLGLEAAARVLFVRPTLRCAEALARFDDQVLDRGVGLVSAGSLRLARWAGLIDDRWVDASVERLAAGARRLGRLARRPQTGRLHQYYLQAVIVLLVAVVVLVVWG